MSGIILLASVVLILCLYGTKLSEKSGVPSLILFIFIGMIMGSEGLIGIQFEDYRGTEIVCSIALIFIMFYGGFGTKWAAAKPVAALAIVLSSLGTVLTALFTTLFCHFALRMSLGTAFLTGSVVSSTDAASVFSILRSKKLSLRYNTDSLLEIESGSNDPFAYMLTTIALTMMGSDGISGWRILLDIVLQIAVGGAAGIAVAYAAIAAFRKMKLSDGFGSVLLIAAAMLSYGAAGICMGNGYLAAYIAGIMIGNAEIKNKKNLVSFFGGFDSIMQILIFFLLGLLSFPRDIIEHAPVAIAIFLFMTLIARPLAVFGIMKPSGSPVNQMLTVSWAGLRGASAIVFAISAAVSPAYMDTEIVHIVFMIVIVSILFQGSLLPFVSRKTDMIDEAGNVLRTFSDYSDIDAIQFINFVLPPKSDLSGRRIMDAELPKGMIIASIERDGSLLLPRGNTVLQPGDVITIGVRNTNDQHKARFDEITIGKNHKWAGKRIRDIQTDKLILLITRENQDFIPDGNTTIMKGDSLLMVGA